MKHKLASSLSSWEYVVSKLISNYPSSIQDIDNAVREAQENNHDIDTEGFIESCEEFISLYLDLVKYSSNFNISSRFRKVFHICSQCLKLAANSYSSMNSITNNNFSLENI